MRFLRSGTARIFIALILGVIVGGFFPEDTFPVAYQIFHFSAQAFIALIKGLIVPLLFSTIVVGIAQTGDLKAVGRMGGKALLYFEIVTTCAMFIGLLVVNVVRPGDHLSLDMSGHTALATAKTGWDIAMHMFPSNIVKHMAEGDVLPLVIFATLFSVSLTRIGERGKIVLEFFEATSQVMFKYTDLIMKLTPVGVFGAMAYSVSHMAARHEVSGVVVQGWPAVIGLLGNYALLVGSLYLSLVLFALFVFTPICWIVGVRFFTYLRAVREPVLTAFSTASSEAALPRLLEDVVKFGVPKRVASFVIPAGYSFNLDGSTLYLVLASVTIAQAAKIHLTFTQQLLMVFTFMLTSKGVAGVPRATLVIIAGTCASFGLPGEAGIAMLLAVDGLMDMARTTINVFGNGLASIVIARWEGVLESPADPHAAPTK